MSFKENKHIPMNKNVVSGDVLFFVLYELAAKLYVGPKDKRQPESDKSDFLNNYYK